MAGLILSGDVFIKRDGVDTGFIKLLNAKSFTVSVAEADKKTRKSFGRDNYGAIIGSYSSPGDHSVAVESDEFDRDTLAMAFLGTTSSVAITGGATSGTVGLVLDQWVQIDDGMPITAATITGFVKDVDFALDLQGGMIKALDAGIVGAQTVSYTTADASGYTISAQTTASLICEVILLGVNLTNNEQVRFHADKATLSPSGDINLLAEDFNSFTMSGLLELVEGATSPYTLTVTS